MLFNTVSRQLCFVETIEIQYGTKKKIGKNGQWGKLNQWGNLVVLRQVDELRLIVAELHQFEFIYISGDSASILWYAARIWITNNPWRHDVDEVHINMHI